MTDRLPPIGKATVEEITSYLDHVVDHNEPQRWQLFREWEFNRLYMRNEQWLEEAIGVALGGVNGQYMSPFLQPIVDEDFFAARPVHNEILPIVQNEVARMMSAGSQVTVPPNDSGPRIKKAAKLAQDVLRAKDVEIGFKRLKQQFIRNQVIYGLGIFLTEVQTDYCKTLKAPKKVMGCASCRWVASIEDAPEGDDGLPLITGPSAISAARRGAAPHNFRMASYFGGSSMEPMLGNLGEGEAPAAAMTLCPDCGDELVVRSASGEESKDYAGKSVHKELPEMDVATQVITPRDFFPAANGRLDADGKCRRWATEQIVSLDYLAQFYEDGYKVKPDEPLLREIAKWHPQGFENGTYIVDGNPRELENHAVLRREVRLPYFEYDPATGEKTYYDRGRWIVMAGKVVLIDDELMVENPKSGKLVPRARVHTAPWEPEDQSIWGIPLVSYLRSPQDNENTAFAQAIEARHDFASPKLMLPPGTNIEYIGQTYGYPNQIYRWSGNEAPEVRTGVALNEQWKFEVGFYQEAMQRISSSRDVEQGNAPKGVTAASALQLLAEKASVTRGPRIESTVMAIQEADSHRLQLIEILYKEKRQFSAGGRGDRLAIKTFTGSDLMGQCDVRIEIEPFVESPVMRREAAAEAFKDGVLVLRTAGDRARYLAQLGVPADIAPGEGLQVDTATDEWLNFVDHEDKDGETILKFGEPPVVKPDFDIDEIHEEQHTIDLFSWEGESMRVNWPKIEIKIAGWKDEYDKLIEGEELLKVEPLEPLPPKPTKKLDGTVDPDEAKALADKWKFKRDLTEKLKTMPKLTELRIFELWKKKCASEEDRLPAIILAETDLALLRWNAHIEGHRYNAKRKRAEASAEATLMPQTPEAAAPTAGQAA